MFRALNRTAMTDGTIKRGGHRRGWWMILPGVIVIVFLIFLPGFINLAGAVWGYGGSESASDTVAQEGGVILLRALVCGLIGGAFALRIGFSVAWIMAGQRFKLPVFFIMCLPAVMGEAAGASAFNAVAGSVVDQLLPLNGYLSMIGYVAWRLSGPVAVAATLLTMLPWKKAVPESMPLMTRLVSGWRRWRTFTGAGLFAGLLVALSGAGHMQLDPDAAGLALNAGPAEFGWIEPARQAMSTWAVLLWPLYIIATAALLVFILRTCAGVQHKDYSRQV